LFKPEIVYEDNHLIVVNKPVNTPVQSDDSGDMDVQLLLKEYIAQKYDKKGNVFLGIVHRLDRPVGGLMVFARTSKAASRLSDAIRKRDIAKYYHAVVHGSIPNSGELIHWLRKDNANNMVSAFDTEVSDSKKAILRYQKVSSRDGLSLVRIELETGRSHQIRVQMAKFGHPLWGDQRYNLKLSSVGQQIALFASELSFVHPTTKELLKFTLPFPQREPWFSL
jgi:23S rRNA pseudouridine1911/1915/1917 synthase